MTHPSGTGSFATCARPPWLTPARAPTASFWIASLTIAMKKRSRRSCVATHRWSGAFCRRTAGPGARCRGTPFQANLPGPGAKGRFDRPPRNWWAIGFTERRVALPSSEGSSRRARHAPLSELPEPQSLHEADAWGELRAWWTAS